MGYTGGTEPSPTYDSVCARNNTHSEALKLAFDPEKTSYEALMQTFVDDPHVRAPFTTLEPSRPQYRTAVWAQSEEQAATARRVLAEGGNAMGVLRAFVANVWKDTRRLSVPEGRLLLSEMFVARACQTMGTT